MKKEKSSNNKILEGKKSKEYSAIVKTVFSVTNDSNSVKDHVNRIHDLFIGFKANNIEEELLISQIITVYESSMECFKKVKFAKGSVKIEDVYLRQANNLSKTYLQLMQLLNKMRGNNISEQKVTVQHVNVNEGGQAIVGNIRGGKNNTE